MKKLLSLLLCFTCCYAAAQDSLQYYNHQRYQITTTGMTVLGSWGAANIIAGGIGWSSTHGNTRYFYQMNTFWGVANLGIAILGYSGAQKDKDKTFTAAETLKEQQKIEKIFLINGGLDFAYIGTGIYLTYRGNTHNSEQLKGYGPAVIMQGAFLLLFDATMYSTHRSKGNKLRKFLEKNPVLFDGKKIGMVINF